MTGDSDVTRIMRDVAKLANISLFKVAFVSAAAFGRLRLTSYNLFKH